MEDAYLDTYMEDQLSGSGWWAEDDYYPDEAYEWGEGEE